MKKTSSILGKYSDGNYRKKGRNSVPPMVEYKQMCRLEKGREGRKKLNSHIPFKGFSYFC